MKRALVINYHEIVTKHERSKNPFEVLKKSFKQQMQLIADKDIPVIRLDDWLYNDNVPDYSIIISFDDGNKSDISIVLPILRHFNFKASFFPTVGEINKQGRLNWSDLKEIVKYGNSIGSHGFTHIPLIQAKRNDFDIDIELKNSKAQLENNLGIKISSFSLPFGIYNDYILERIKIFNYDSALTTKRRINKSTNKFLIHRWNIKNTTDLNEFEKLITLERKYLKLKRLQSDISFNVNSFRKR